jgi:hypothetical protein
MTFRLGAIALAMTLLVAACGDDDSATTQATTRAPGGTTPSTTAPGTTTPGTTTPGTAPATTATTATAVDVCPDEHFLLDVNDFRAAGQPTPSLAVHCEGGNLIVETNDIIAYEFVSMTPNGLEAQDFTFEIPLDPTPAATPGGLPLGAVGVSVNGISAFAAFEAPQDGYRDPFLDGLLDFCNGHTADGGWYHYHARWDCVFDQTRVVGLVYGYAMDGYQMVSPWICANADCTELREATSSYVRVDPNGLGAFDAWEYRAGSGDLDECNGMTGDDGVYRYYMTDEFPYMQFCYHGVTDAADGDFVAGEPPNGLFVDSVTPAGGPPGGGGAP